MGSMSTLTPPQTHLPALHLDHLTEADLARLAAILNKQLTAGDIIALWGNLGAGKTTFARSLLASAGIAENVPSPTFTLVQTYTAPDGRDFWHFDLYRLEQPEDAWELDIEDAFTDGISLIEWPDRLGDLLPETATLHLQLTIEDDTHRTLQVTAGGAWEDRWPHLTQALQP